MSKQTIVISGEGVSVTFNGVAISDINTVAFGVLGERAEINLTTIDATLHEVGLLSKLQKLEDIVINKKFDPKADSLITDDNAQLVINYKTGGANAKHVTFWAQRKNASFATLERKPDTGINHDLTFFVTNLNSSLAETGPAIAS